MFQILIFDYYFIICKKKLEKSNLQKKKILQLKLTKISAKMS